MGFPRCPLPGLRALSVYSLLFGLGQSVENRCVSSNAVTCTTCLSIGSECGWCTQEDFMVEATKSERCDILFNLIYKGCSSDLIEYPSARVTIPSVQEANTQVTPGEVSIQLHPGAEASFMLTVRHLEKYPVDLYYLVDVSASMHKSIENLNSIGFDLSQKMTNVSRDFRFGFGSFVDKAMTPYSSSNPHRVNNPCSGFRSDCMPSHGYIHVLSLTDNVTEFRNAVRKQKLSGNIDAPEGVFDAMLQAAVCERQIGWRKEAKRLLLMMTDQTSHLALDSKLAGIVVPNDGNCHLSDNVYTRSTSMEHPSLGQLAEKLIDNNIIAVFAVQGSTFHWYEDLLPLLPGNIAKQLEPTAVNLKELVIDAYQKLLSEVKIQVDNPIKGLQINITALCPDGTRKPGLEGCTNMKSNDEVLLNVTVTMNGCNVVEDRNYIIIKPIGFNETAKIIIHKNCNCQCDGHSRHKGKYVDEAFLDCSYLDCEDINCGSEENVFPTESCRLFPGQPVCSGRGVCVCGKCVCHKTKLGKIYGRYCENDDFACPYHHGNLCAGNGECEAGNCKCFSGWEGDRCQCPSSIKHCVNSEGLICSGRGTCKCGACECTDPRSFGTLCEHCQSCSNTCEENWNCVQCNISNLSETTSDQCQTSCHKRVYYIDQGSVCFSDPSHFRIFLIIFIVTFLIGLLTILIIRQIILQWNMNKIKSSANCGVATTKKEAMFFPAVCTRTAMYRQDKPEEIKFSISKLQVNETFMYKC
ncbi:integrin beta-8 [Rhinatrema bivittatum]|uniref:integrin beta-8 n=1 Tax=Rhinatrema bivittatum TaxID=194408 RepID=UPI00112662CA|nr:integrin beta-8 [Rhinatrema bivittatum]